MVSLVLAKIKYYDFSFNHNKLFLIRIIWFLTLFFAATAFYYLIWTFFFLFLVILLRNTNNFLRFCFWFSTYRDHLRSEVWLVLVEVDHPLSRFIWDAILKDITLKRDRNKIWFYSMVNFNVTFFYIWYQQFFFFFAFFLGKL